MNKAKADQVRTMMKKGLFYDLDVLQKHQQMSR